MRSLGTIDRTITLPGILHQDKPGAFIRQRRRALHMSQAELAQRVGVTQTRISEIELGRGASVSVELAARILHVLADLEAAEFERMLYDEAPGMLDA
ncbi:MAG: helix-turn-helix transcriptional regulator [Thermomicrobiales bacterium]